jgi:hypothetical protein
MKLHKAKLLHGSLGGTRLEWLCSELESRPFPPGSKSGPRYIGCVDYTVPSHAASVFFMNKNQPPEPFDWHPHAVRSTYEQLAFGQIICMDWEKLKNGDHISFDSQMEQQIRKWGGEIWSGGSIASIRKDGEVNVLELKEQSVKDRDIGHYLTYIVKNKEY